MNKAIKYTRNGAIIFGIGNGLFNVLKQLNKIDNEPFNWKQFFLATGKGAAVGASGGFILGSIEDRRTNKILNNTGGSVPRYLNGVVNNHDKTDNTFIIEKANQLKQKLYYKFKHDLFKYPSFNGSIIKGTSIQNSDVDIQLRFKKPTGTIEHVFNKVYEFLNYELDDEAITNVRKQKHSIGITYDVNGEKYRIDIVPTRISKNAFNDDYIYVNETSLFGQSTFKKINPSKQLRVLNFTNQERKVVKLLKMWKNENDIDIKSIYLELLVKKAFQNGTLPRNIDKCLLEVLNYLGENIHKIRIIDPANSNNIISDTISYDEKVSLGNYCLDMISKIKKDRRNIIDYFPPTFLPSY
ncbi:hypothetical protein [Confluentibacter sediminis]|uniref:hypothetical protein n=1 Tax=Confluentibacter sediminis TaxID=2219045 RepID=UPI000DAD85A2|nr:hypothetical protein [Confluentibacter sediminis]